jgi:transmembrane sensor
MKPDYHVLIHKSLTGEINEAERKMLNTWLEKDSNQKTADELRTVWESFSAADDFKPIDEIHFQQQRDRIDHTLKEARRRETARFHSAILYRNVAIFALLIISFTFLVAWLVQYRSAGAVTIAVDKNQTLVLADGSLVSLNKSSKLTFSQSWSERNAEFQGDAFFQVAKNRKPFLIQLPHGSVRVLGTSFFVRAHPGETAEVVVSSGTVELLSENQKMTLSKGYKGTLLPNNGRIIKSVNDDPNFNSWYTRNLQFEKTSFNEITRLLEDHYPIKFKVSDPQLLSCRFTGTFRDEAPGTILKVLSRSLGFSFTLRDGVYFIEGKGCNNSK